MPTIAGRPSWFNDFVGDKLMSMRISEIINYGERPCTFNDSGDKQASDMLHIDKSVCQFHDFWLQAIVLALKASSFGTRSRLNVPSLKDSCADSMILGCTMTDGKPICEGCLCEFQLFVVARSCLKGHSLKDALANSMLGCRKMPKRHIFQERPCKFNVFIAN